MKCPSYQRLYLSSVGIAVAANPETEEERQLCLQLLDGQESVDSDPESAIVGEGNQGGRRFTKEAVELAKEVV